MSDQNVKMKTSTTAPSGNTEGKSPQPASSKESKQAHNPAASAYDEKDTQSVVWSLMKKGMSPQDQKSEPMGLLGEYASVINQKYENNMKYPDKAVPFRPKNLFEALRMHFEIPDPTEDVDISDILPYIPKYSELKSSIGDKGMIEAYYCNRIKALDELIAHRRGLLENTDNNFALDRYKKDEIYLTEKLEFVKIQLLTLYDDTE